MRAYHRTRMRDGIATDGAQFQRCAARRAAGRGVTDLPAADLLYVNLPRGRDRAQSLGSLAERLGWSRRTVEAAVQECRLSGRPVASCAQGVYVGDLRDIEETMAQLERRLASQYATLRAMRRCRDGLRKVQQQTLWAS